MNAKQVASVASVFVTLMLAVIGAYLSIDRHVTAMAATAISQSQVEHLIDLKTADKLDEIIRRLQSIDSRMDRLQVDQQNTKLERKGQN